MKNKILNVFRKILLIISISVGVCMIVLGVNYIDEGVIPVAYTGMVEDASFGADYYTLTYQAAREEVNALRIVSNGTQYTANNLVIIIRMLAWLSILLGALVSIFSAFVLLGENSVRFHKSIKMEHNMPTLEEEIL